MTIEQDAAVATGMIPGINGGLPHRLNGRHSSDLIGPEQPQDSIAIKLEEIHPAGHTDTHVNVGGVLRAQKTFIQAQTRYLHTQDVPMLAGSQLDFTRSLSVMLISLDPAKAANVQEKYIAELTEALEEKGII